MITDFNLYVNEMAYPSNFDMEYFKTLNSFKSRVEYCEKYLNRISSGSSRIVYKIDDEKVLKLAKNTKGIAQCEKEISLSNDYYIADLVANCFESHPDSLQVEMELAGKVKKADFQKIIGVSFEDFSNYIKYNYYTTIKTKRFSISNDIKEKCQENEFIMSVIDYIASYDIGEIAVGDLCRLSTYGIVKRNGEDCIVMIDYGIDEDISNKYYKKMMNIFVIGDIHAEYQKLEEVIKKSNIDKENDMLITLGDVVDSGADQVKVLDILMEFKNIVNVRGNHDLNFLNWINTGVDEFGGEHGSRETIIRQIGLSNPDKEKYKQQFIEQKTYFILNNICFVHGGFNPYINIKNQNTEDLCQNGNLIQMSLSRDITTKNEFTEVYIGHTPTMTYSMLLPNYSDTPYIPTYTGNLIQNIDTGSGKGGLLTIMNIKTKEFQQA